MGRNKRRRFKVSSPNSNKFFKKNKLEKLSFQKNDLNSKLFSEIIICLESVLHVEKQHYNASRQNFLNILYNNFINLLEKHNSDKNKSEKPVLDSNKIVEEIYKIIEDEKSKSNSSCLKYLSKINLTDGIKELLIKSLDDKIFSNNKEKNNNKHKTKNVNNKPKLSNDNKSDDSINNSKDILKKIKDQLLDKNENSETTNLEKDKQTDNLSLKNNKNNSTNIPASKNKNPINLSNDFKKVTNINSKFQNIDSNKINNQDNSNISNFNTNQIKNDNLKKEEISIKQKLYFELKKRGKTFLKDYAKISTFLFKHTFKNIILFPFNVGKLFYKTFFKKAETKKEAFIQTLLRIFFLNKNVIFWTTVFVTKWFQGVFTIFKSVSNISENKKVSEYSETMKNSYEEIKNETAPLINIIKNDVIPLVADLGFLAARITEISIGISLLQEAVNFVFERYLKGKISAIFTHALTWFKTTGLYTIARHIGTRILQALLTTVGAGLASATVAIVATVGATICTAYEMNQFYKKGHVSVEEYTFNQNYGNFKEASDKGTFGFINQFSTVNNRIKNIQNKNYIAKVRQTSDLSETYGKDYEIDDLNGYTHTLSNEYFSNEEIKNLFDYQINDDPWDFLYVTQFKPIIDSFNELFNINGNNFFKKYKNDFEKSLFEYFKEKYAGSKPIVEKTVLNYGYELNNSVPHYAILDSGRGLINEVFNKIQNVLAASQIFDNFIFNMHNGYLNSYFPDLYKEILGDEFSRENIYVKTLKDKFTDFIKNVFSGKIGENNLYENLTNIVDSLLETKFNIFNNQKKFNDLITLNLDNYNSGIRARFNSYAIHGNDFKYVTIDGARPNNTDDQINSALNYGDYRLFLGYKGNFVREDGRDSKKLEDLSALRYGFPVFKFGEQRYLKINPFLESLGIYFGNKDGLSRYSALTVEDTTDYGLAKNYETSTSEISTGRSNLLNAINMFLPEDRHVNALENLDTDLRDYLNNNGHLGFDKFNSNISVEDILFMKKLLIFFINEIDIENKSSK